jgi:thioredoxin-dependent peroxiredoxin
MLGEGSVAPDFTVPDDHGRPVTLSGHRGGWVLLWWYPKADTPGWTIQGKGLRDQAHEYEAAGCIILGISFDTSADNRTFSEKFDFPFPLLSDADEQVGVAYDVRDPGTDKVHFAKRVAYLIDPEGVIRKAYAVGDVNAFAGDVLGDLRALQGR